MKRMTSILALALAAHLGACASTPATPDTTEASDAVESATTEAGEKAEEAAEKTEEGKDEFDTKMDKAMAPVPGVPFSELYTDENVDHLNTFAFAMAEYEEVGELRNGLTEQQVVEILGVPEERSSQDEWYGSAVDAFLYPSKGYTLIIERTDDLSGKVLSLTATAPAVEVTKLGIKVGSTEAELREAYGAMASPRDSRPRSLSIGFMYTWVQFGLTDGLVDMIHIGTGDPMYRE